jgi:hypothetical protein
LKADLTCEFVCRLLNYMDHHDYGECVPRKHGAVAEAPWLDFTSGYVTRAMSEFPKQGTKKPWKLYQNYALDLFTLKFGAINDGVMAFKKSPTKTAARAPERMAAE